MSAAGHEFMQVGVEQVLFVIFVVGLCAIEEISGESSDRQSKAYIFILLQKANNLTHLTIIER